MFPDEKKNPSQLTHTEADTGGHIRCSQVDLPFVCYTVCASLFPIRLLDFTMWLLEMDLEGY